MRMLLKMSPGTEAGSRAVRDGRMEKVLTRTLEQIHPESAWFAPEHGLRTAWIVFDLKDASQIPSIVEPLFDELGATVEIVPVMNVEDLKKGLASVGRGH